MERRALPCHLLLLHNPDAQSSVWATSPCVCSSAMSPLTRSPCGNINRNIHSYSPALGHPMVSRWCSPANHWSNRFRGSQSSWLRLWRGDPDTALSVCVAEQQGVMGETLTFPSLLFLRHPNIQSDVRATPSYRGHTGLPQVANRCPLPQRPPTMPKPSPASRCAHWTATDNPSDLLQCSDCECLERFQP